MITITIQEYSTGSLIKKLEELRKCEMEIMKELEKRYDKENNSAKKFIKKATKKN